MNLKKYPKINPTSKKIQLNLKNIKLNKQINIIKNISKNKKYFLPGFISSGEILANILPINNPENAIIAVKNKV
jgi:hypothetical protein